VQNGAIGLAAAFAAGIVSFLTPCVLPLIPVYVSFMTGMTLNELGDEDRDVRRVLVPMLFFVAGFSVVFVALGASASLLGNLLGRNRDALGRVAGIVVIAMGLVLLGVLPAPWLRRAGGVDASRLRRFGGWAAFALGVAFPLAMGPCSGPIYGAILTMAANTASVSRGAMLLGTYSLGLALPFLLTGLLFSRLVGLLRRAQRLARVLNAIAGAVLVALGALMVAGLATGLSVWIERAITR